MTSSPRSLRVATVQFQPVMGDKQANLSIVTRLARAAAADGADIIVFPEMCLVGYWHLRRRSRSELDALSEQSDGELIDAVSGLSRELGAAIGVGFLENRDQRLYNSYAVCLPDGSVHVHRKLHAFEHEEIASGDAFTVFDTPWGVRVGVLICWDNNLVENVRITALAGAELLLAPHQTGGTDSRSPFGMKRIPLELWRDRASQPEAMHEAIIGPNGREWLMRWLPSRAHDNGMFIAFSNGIGEDDDEIRTGNSMIIDPYGRIIAETSAADEAIVTADLALDLLPLSTGRRWIAGRRPGLYRLLTVESGRERNAREARFLSDPPALRAPTSRVPEQQPPTLTSTSVAQNM